MSNNQLPNMGTSPVEEIIFEETDSESTQGPSFQLSMMQTKKDRHADVDDHNSSTLAVRPLNIMQMAHRRYRDELSFESDSDQNYRQNLITGVYSTSIDETEYSRYIIN